MGFTRSAYGGRVKEFIVYTLARFAVFGVLYLAIIGIVILTTDGGIPILWPILAAAVLSTVVSSYLLRGLRDRLAARISERAERMSQKFEELKAKEDQD